MIGLFWPLIRAGLFQLDAEVAHEWTLWGLDVAPGLLGALLDEGTLPESLGVDVGGVRWAGPVGLAAGLDKDGRGIPVWGRTGFGSVEIGTVTAHAQPGNERPRLFRLPADRALINRMGFNNHGSEALAAKIRGLKDRGRWSKVPVGANLGKSKVTPLEEAAGDYALSATRLRGLVDWFTINVSSPNTPGLRDLQEARFLTELLPRVVEAGAGTPVFLKLAPDLEDEALDEAVELAIRHGIAAIVATNTTLRREGLTADPGEKGGLSGRPLWPLARERVSRVVATSAGRIPVVGVGGVETADQVRELLAIGCKAVQLYSALIYEGPSLPARLHRELARP
jgi:dihydroorotate dehydrogenase